MARPLRIEYDGAIYHVMARGNQGRDLFAIEWERRCWLGTLEEVVDRAGWRVHAYVQTTTHYHMLLETPSANLVAGMKWFQQTFTQRTNAFHKSWGHVYQGRYKAILVDDEDALYFRTEGEYIHLNPVEAGLVSVKDSRLELYPRAYDGIPGGTRGRGESSRRHWGAKAGLFIAGSEFGTYSIALP